VGVSEAGHLLAPWGLVVGYHGLLHLVGDDGAEFMAIFTHWRLEAFDPIVEEVGDNYRCLGRGGAVGGGFEVALIAPG
jgi:hypothetical protein